MLASYTTKRNSQMDAAAAELESHMFDCSGDGASCENETNFTDYAKQSNELGHTRMSGTGGGDVQQMLAEHTIISEAFLSAATCSWFEKDKALLASLLSSLKSLWAQPQWQACLKHLCCHGDFRRAMLKIVKLFEKELKNHRVETDILHKPDQISYSTLISLVSLIVPPLLKLIRFVHALWTNEAVFRFPEELIEARKLKNVDQILRFKGEMLEFLDVSLEELEENDLAQWLQLMRESGYNLLGLCATIKGAFSELLDISSINDAIMENIRSMEFRHVAKLIDLVIIPFIKHCPHNLWEEWMLKLLLPLFDYCGDMLHYSWFTLLNNGRADVPHYFGYLCGSEETVNKMENYLLLDLTRKVSKLLGALASQELNHDVCHAALHSVLDKCTPSTSLVGYILLNGCFESLSMDVFGWWVDGEAAIDSVPFCHALVQVAVDSNNEKLRRFVKDDMLRAIVHRLCDDLPCAVQKTIRKLSPLMNLTKCRKASKDLFILCQEIYEVYIQCQDLEGEDQDNDSTAHRFEDWFTNQKKDLCVKASSAIPDEFPAALWNWEFEEEFRRYLPTYLDVLHEVDAMDDCLEGNCLDSTKIFENLSLEFRSRHAISSCTDHLVWMISNLLQRKMPAAYSEQRSDQISKCICKLITSKPYIKRSDGWNNAMKRLEENFEINLHTRLSAEDAVDIFYISILRLWEPQFHPLIREGQKDVLVKIARQFAFAKERENYEPLEPDSLDFLDHLQLYASFYIYRKKKESGYFMAREQVKLHEEFDRFLDSGKLDSDICKLSCLQIAKSQFVQLDKKLVILSLEQRAQLLDTQRQKNAYAECLRNILTDQKLQDGLQRLISELEVQGFFDVDNNSIDWEKGCFLPLVDKFEGLVFKGHSFPQYLVIQGIMDYRKMSQQSDSNLKDSFEQAVNWRQDLTRIWMATRYYEGLYYDVLRKPLKKIFMQNTEASKL
ncbi:uncharacterized protein LOC102721490 isoform X2 [Oryza brachyantha]|uniref:uncharacterized protein LOC102721490 isoform X2 n=1 Tax=Oryza brachyantha TaxID=4533 RepID=UPI0007761F6A|nr:uncharacterized protein LOC102721490 isoform X2 [Oryza brachyantha]